MRASASAFFSRSFDCSPLHTSDRLPVSTMNFPFLVLRSTPNVNEAKKVHEMSTARIPRRRPFAVLGSIAAEFHQARLFGVQFKMEPLRIAP